MVCRNHMKNKLSWILEENTPLELWCTLLRALALGSDHLQETLTLYLLDWEAIHHPVSLFYHPQRVSWSSLNSLVCTSGFFLFLFVFLNKFEVFQSLVLWIFFLLFSFSPLLALPSCIFWCAKCCAPFFWGFIFVPSFPLCSLDYIVSITLSWRFLNLSSDSLNLLLSPFSEFLFQLLHFSAPEFPFGSFYKKLFSISLLIFFEETLSSRLSFLLFVWLPFVLWIYL